MTERVIDVISLPQLAVALALVIVVMLIHVRWALKSTTVIYAAGRMIVQLIMLGFILNFVFDHANAGLTVAILGIMAVMASWIALRPLRDKRNKLLVKALLAITLGGGVTLLLIIAGVMQPAPWYKPQTVLPLAGMIFAYAMNGVSLAADRFYSEIQHKKTYVEARAAAYQTSLIPLTNAFLAVGLVSLPGVMTGQILAGVSPLITIRYQIMIMCMVFGSAGMSSAIFLSLIKGQSDLR